MAPSITEQPGRAIDGQQVLAALPPMARMNLGWRDAVIDAERGVLMARIGSGRVLRKLIIRLNGADLYDIEIGRMHRRSYEWIVEGQTHGIYAEQLADAAIRLHARVTA